MGTYVVGDIHGCFDEWMQLKGRIEARDTGARFVLTGDIIDRGPKVVEMIDWALENITADGRYQMVRGNHEQEKIDWFCRWTEKGALNGSADYRRWMRDRYNFQESLARHGISFGRLEEIIRFFRGLPVYKELYINTGERQGKHHYVVVHAYLPRRCVGEEEAIIRETLTLPDTEEGELFPEVSRNIQEVIWNRNESGYEWLHATTVVHGHTPTLLYGDTKRGRIHCRKNDINVDCGLVYRMEESNLAAIRLEDRKEFYLYPPNSR